MEENGHFSEAGFWQEPDFLLTELVSLMANKMDVQLGITLLVKGTILSGLLVSEREYLAAINELFKTITKGSLDFPTREDIQAIDEVFKFDQLTEDTYTHEELSLDEEDPADAQVEESDEDEDDTEDDEEQPAFHLRYLHLKDPVIIYPGAAVQFGDSALPIMRIRLTTVDGWMMGRSGFIDIDDLPHSQIHQ